MRNNVDPNQVLLRKLEKPVHINYISDYILRVGIDETRKRIEKLVTEGVLEESKYGKEYYVRTKRNG
jgi:hypothetical protein